MTYSDVETDNPYAHRIRARRRQEAIRDRTLALPADADLGNGIMVLMALDAAGFDHEESMRLLEDVLGCARSLRATDETLVLG